MATANRQDVLQRQLDQQRARFARFVKDELQPGAPNAAHAELSDERGPGLSSADIARMIPDAQLRRRYVDEAVALFDANIAYERENATPRLARVRSRAWVGAATLLAIALAWSQGATAALIVGAGVYWFAAETAHRWQVDDDAAVRLHNDGVVEAASTVKGWEDELAELQRVD